MRPSAGAGLVRHVVLDRDGVLNRESVTPVTDPDEWVWETNARAGLCALAAADVVVSVVTNQAAIGRGEASADAVDRLHRWLTAELTDLGLTVVGIFVCPHTDGDGCRCRKPLPGMVQDAIARSGHPADAALLVGDDRRDLEAAAAAGVAAVLVRTGKGRHVEAEFGHESVAADLLDAATRYVR